jgi:hypothetical protein
MSGYPERVRRGAGLAERDLQRPLADRFVLAHELVPVTVPQLGVTVLVDVHATRAAPSVGVDEHAEGHWLTGAS